VELAHRRSGFDHLRQSWSEEKLWEPAFDLIRSARVVKLSLFGRMPEIDLALTDDRHVVSFMTGDGQPEWSLTDRRSSPHTWVTVCKGTLFEDDGRTPSD
jgi:hypothetical protein